MDAQGNSCLHCAAYRGHKETAVLLLQNGIDTNIRNNRGLFCLVAQKTIQMFYIFFYIGQLAVDLARDAQTIQILNVKSVRRVTKSVNRLEGPLLKRSRFLGWKPVWVSNLSSIEIKIYAYWNIEIYRPFLNAVC